MINIESYHQRADDYLRNKLIPFWEPRLEEPEHGGFQTNYDRDGKRTEVSEKTFLAQARCLFVIAFVMRQGFPFNDGEGLLERGYRFLKQHFEDPECGGFFWIVKADGSVQDDNKVIYGHSFLLYALSEWALLSGDPAIKTDACALFELIQEKARDDNGGYIEHFHLDFTPRPARGDVGCHKSLDVHMHLMEAFTTLYELTGDERHKQALDEVTSLILKHMIDPQTGTGMAMFTQTWQPIANVELDTVWGEDRFEDEKTVDITSYGHNIELAWLFTHMLKIRQLEINPHREWLERVYRHSSRHGVDREYGGLYVEGHKMEGVTETNKEFWQQCEALVGFLDAYQLTGDASFLDDFANVQNFVFDKVINWEQGEYFALLNRQGDVLWDYMAHNWKICYHTLRASCLVVRKLEEIRSCREP